MRSHTDERDPMSTLTSEAKAKLAQTVRTLRDRLLTDLHNAADSAYRLALPLAHAGLDEEHRVKRQRLEAWLDEQTRSNARGKQETVAQARERHRLTAEKLAAATLLNRLVVIKHMEALGLIRPAVVTGGWQSPGYREFRACAPVLLRDDTEGFSTLLHLVYEELAQELPGLFGDVGVSGLFPIPAATLRAVIEVCDDPALESAWTDDTTLGWVYQFWNDPEREELDNKINNGGKIERHEIAAKTQLFTDRYMVEWLLQNSLGQQWLAICAKHGWIPDVRANGALDALEERRKVWKTKRAAGEISVEAMMPIESEEEQRWKYWVPQPLSREAIEAAPNTIRMLKILDPAVGSGHFLVIAFDLLAAFYQEEARHRGEHWTPKQVAESIFENNLHGVDLDPRAIQIAAAVLWLKGKTFCRDAEPRVINLVASNLGLASLPDDDPAVQALRREVQKTTGIPEALTNMIMHALKGSDYLGSLLKVDEAVEVAIQEHERTAGLMRTEVSQGDMFAGFRPEQTLLSFDEAKVSVLEQLDRFLAKCTSADDLGLRLRGEQLAAGVRFVRLIKASSYDLVIANPPYHSAGKLAEPGEFQKLYPEGGADLFSVFMQRTLQLVKTHGLAATVTLSNWLYLGTYEELRGHLMDSSSIMLLADLGKAAFSSGSMLINASMNIIQRTPNKAAHSLAVRPFAPKEVIVDPRQVLRNEAALLAGAALFYFEAHKLRAVIKGQPLIYWWEAAFLKRYAETPKMEDVAVVREGLTTSNNSRFLRKPWEPRFVFCATHKERSADFDDVKHNPWIPYIKGAAGRVWFEPLDHLLLWRIKGIEVKILNDYLHKSYTRSVRSEELYFTKGVAYTTTGTQFAARAHRFLSIFGAKGRSVFGTDLGAITCSMNARIAKNIMESLNPTIDFSVGDVNRLPLFPIESADEIFAKLEAAFTEHEAARETSVEFKYPGPSAWHYAQEWAQVAVDREPGTPLPDYQPVYNAPPATHYVSYAIGVALGRFGANGEGILNEAPAIALPAGILYLSAYSDNDSLRPRPANPLQTLGPGTETPFLEAHRYAPGYDSPFSAMSTWACTITVPSTSHSPRSARTSWRW